MTIIIFSAVVFIITTETESNKITNLSVLLRMTKMCVARIN